MTGEEFAKLCFAARPVLWALAIIAILFFASILVPKILGFDSGDEPPSKSPGPGLPL
jgi:hypothetical protein